MSGPLDTDIGTELFASHEADFKLVQADITQKLDQINELHGEPRKAAIRALERVVDEADEIVFLLLRPLFMVEKLPNRLLLA